ncbi:hypothetical protein E0Z10_g5643 [Xylaria hypoxylon]|uniref:Tyrosinase copper-binding domain-containing protein n=1 Tax=Xylaria hypoxylon TaxID=37992 RepID=A0A4Z0Z0G8_9PEZI|nr:hypothetical protein E0Z10_g5643 [Xylaria hypoxylon]
MRYSIASQALCGAITVSAFAVPNTQVQKRVQHVDISSFKSFPTADPQKYFDKADSSIREFFNIGMFNDGPMDEFGDWLDRPVAVLEDIKDKLQLKNAQDFFVKAHVDSVDLREKFKSAGKYQVKGFKGQIKSRVGNRSKYSLYDWGDLFKNPFKQPEQPKKSPASDEDTSENEASNQPAEPSDNNKDTPGDNTSGENTSGANNPVVNNPVVNNPVVNNPVVNNPGENNSGGSTSTNQPKSPPASPENTSGNNASDESKKSPNGGETAAADGTCNPSNAHVRFEWDSYSQTDRTAFVEAIKCLQTKPSGGSKYTGSQNRYEDLISVHRDMTADIHQTAAFLVWHRYFVWVFEQLLRDECGFNRAMPWWDETKHAGAFANSDIFTDAWFGHLPAMTSDNQGTCIESGEFSNTMLHVGPGSGNTDHCLSRAVDESQTAQCNKDFTNSCLSMKSYEEFRDCFELGPHGYGHNGIGAVMAEVSASVGDPIFFMHHLFVDHTFRIWQNAMPSRRTTISGCADKANPCTPITLDTKLSTSGLRPDVTVREVLNTLSGTICYRYDY